MYPPYHQDTKRLFQSFQSDSNLLNHVESSGASQRLLGVLCLPYINSWVLYLRTSFLEMSLHIISQDKIHLYNFDKSNQISCIVQMFL